MPYWLSPNDVSARSTSIFAIDGKWLRGVLDGQVKLLSAMLHDQKVVIGQVRVPDDTTEVTYRD
jgi:hypothetical protein